MAVTAKVLGATLSASVDGSVDVTSSGFGTPDAVLIWANSVVTLGSSPTSESMSFGATDGVNQWSMSYTDMDAQDPTVAYRYKSIAEAVMLKDGAGNVVTASVSVIKDGVRLTNLTGSGACHVTLLLLRGVKNVYAGSLTMNGTTPVDVTAPGFKPSVLFAAWNSLATGSSSATDAILSLGVAHNSSTDVVTQSAVAIGSRHNVGTAISATTVRSNGIAADPDAPTTRYFTVSGFDASGFSIVSAATATTDLFYLAIELADPDAFDVTVRDSATTAGNAAYTGTGFAPLAVGFYGSVETVTNTASAEGASLTVGLMDSATEKSLEVGGDNGATTAATFASGSMNALALRFADGTPDAIATRVSLDADGFTVNHSSAGNASAAARKMVTWAFGAGANGTERHYWVVYPDGESTPSAAQIVAGQKQSGAAATSSGSVRAPTASGVVYAVNRAQGLAAGTAYRLAVVAFHDGTSTYSSVVVSAAFTTNPQPSHAESSAASDSSTAWVVRVGLITETAATVDTQTAGGTTYNDSQTESLASTDAQAATLEISAAQSESSAAADSQSALAEMLAAITESAAIADSQTTGGVANSSITESSAATDTQTSQAVLVASVTESAAIADAATTLATLVAAITESAAINGTQSAGPQYFSDITETAALADASTGTAVLVATRAEASAASDTATGVAVLVAQVLEASQAQDAQQAAAVLSAVISEAAAIADSSIASAVFVRTIQEAVALADASTGTVLVVAVGGGAVETFYLVMEVGPWVLAAEPGWLVSMDAGMSVAAEPDLTM